MNHYTDNRDAASRLSCDSCGQLPHPHRLRLALAKLIAVFPAELLLHALVIHYHLSYAMTVAVLALATTVLVIWVVEPSAMRVLRGWLHAPTLGVHRRLGEAPALWRMRVTLDDEPGALERLTHQLAGLDVNILSLHVHPLDQGVRDELVVAAPEHVHAADLVALARAGGATNVHAWSTTALALVDGQTKALTLAARVSENPSELPLAAAELLEAQVVTDRSSTAAARAGGHGPHETELRIPSPWTGMFTLCRPDEPFTPAEWARASRLAEIAEIAELRVRNRAVAPRSSARSLAPSNPG